MKHTKPSKKVETVEFAPGIGIWGNTECVQCGACCYNYDPINHKYNDNEQCKHFLVKDGRACCTEHYSDDRDKRCQTFFCGNGCPTARFEYRRDESLRAIAKRLRTTPAKYRIPVFSGYCNGPC